MPVASIQPLLLYHCRFDLLGESVDYKMGLDFFKTMSDDESEHSA